jgi:hypothetical protein
MGFGTSPKIARMSFWRVRMNNVDWLALWAEFAQATDNKQLEVAERIVYHDGRWDLAQLSSSGSG